MRPGLGNTSVEPCQLDSCETAHPQLHISFSELSQRPRSAPDARALTREWCAGACHASDPPLASSQRARFEAPCPTRGMELTCLAPKTCSS